MCERKEISLSLLKKSWHGEERKESEEGEREREMLSLLRIVISPSTFFSASSTNDKRDRKRRKVGEVRKCERVYMQYVSNEQSVSRHLCMEK